MAYVSAFPGDDNAAEVWSDSVYGLRLCDIFEVTDDLVEEALGAVLVGAFPALVHKGKLHLVSGFQEVAGMIHFGFIVMLVDGRPHFDFLDLNGFLPFARFPGPPLLFVDDLLIVYDFTDGGFCLGCNLNQVEFGFFSTA